MPYSQIGFLVPLNNNSEEDDSIPKLPILEGVNVFGRDNISVSDKRVSRKHISLKASVDGSVEVVVEGSNPVVIRAGDQRKKLYSKDKATIAHGNILELIPGHHVFKYVTSAGAKDTSSPQTHKRSLKEGGKLNEDEIQAKKKRQIAEDEAFARNLQAELANNSTVQERSLVVEGSENSQSHRGTCPASHEVLEAEAIRQFSVHKNRQPLTFRLLQVKGLPPWANSNSVSISDVIQGNVLVAILSNYMVDIDWLISACPAIRKIPHVLIIHGEGDGTLDHLKVKPANWILHKPPLPISYGTHHSKAMLLVYPRGVRIIVHTANLINVDWNNKSQGLWMQDFPWKDQKDVKKGHEFENDLIDYLSVLKWPEFSVNLPDIGNATINSSFFKKFDYSSAAVRLIASVPGYHMGPKLKKWGHMKLRTVLQESYFDKEFQKSPLVYQFSSLGSLDEKWMAELASSMSAGFSDDKTPLGLGQPLIIWPSVEDVRCSLEGYAAGNAIPSPQKNVEKDFLKKYWAKWKATHTGRSRAMPHIKTYTRYSGQKIAWFLLTSANLSKAAWGALQKNNSQLMIRSYELGVLFLPSSTKQHGYLFSCTDNGGSSEVICGSSQNAGGHRRELVTLCWRGNQSMDSSSEVIPLPIPYELPPQPYSSEDVPWSWDRRYSKKDVYGQVWPRQVKLYVSQDS
ncbi:tyrosyl-DNA phosphodiesterase 1 isoform X2 [Telopea speciosissima]|uniref:tyrosyl-DNA phosphodiesterase 1 isoform X2 n=1 Tax=Telopea speciosissima TaxID=54955 RepID=UPI001CC36E7D|nr:tyrosyl-DNA phosphodiesterase 1 isoform X2 [Telopea speciosissima]